MTTATISKVFPSLTTEQFAQAGARLTRLQKIHNLTFLQLEDYRKGSDGSWGYNTRADGDVSYGDLKESDLPDYAGDYLFTLSTDDNDSGEVYFYLPYATGSDYSGSTVERSNYVSFLETYGKEDFVHTVYGGYNTYAVAIGLTGLLTCVDDTADAILDALEGLEDYPCLDEQALSALEDEQADCAWKDWVAGDFVSALEAKFRDVADLELPTGPELRTFFEKKCGEANESWFNEGSGHEMYVRIDEVVKCIEFGDIAQWAVVYVVTYCDDGTVNEDYSEEAEALERVVTLRKTGFPGAHYTVHPPVKE